MSLDELVEQEIRLERYNLWMVAYEFSRDLVRQMELEELGRDKILRRRY